MTKKLEYKFGGIKECEFDQGEEFDESNLLLKAYAAIPASTGSDPAPSMGGDSAD